MTLDQQAPSYDLVLGSNRSINLWANSRRWASNYQAGPPPRRPQAPLALAPAGRLIPAPTPAHSQALAALHAGLPVADADPLVRGQGVARVWLWECPSPVPVQGEEWEMGVAPQETAASALVWARQADL